MRYIVCTCIMEYAPVSAPELSEKMMMRQWHALSFTALCWMSSPLLCVMLSSASRTGTAYATETDIICSKHKQSKDRQPLRVHIYRSVQRALYEIAGMPSNGFWQFCAATYSSIENYATYETYTNTCTTSSIYFPQLLVVYNLTTFTILSD